MFFLCREVSSPVTQETGEAEPTTVPSQLEHRSRSSSTSSGTRSPSPRHGEARRDRRSRSGSRSSHSRSSSRSASAQRSRSGSSERRSRSVSPSAETKSNVEASRLKSPLPTKPEVTGEPQRRSSGADDNHHKPIETVEVFQALCSILLRLL